MSRSLDRLHRRLEDHSAALRRELGRVQHRLQNQRSRQVLLLGDRDRLDEQLRRRLQEDGRTGFELERMHRLVDRAIAAGQQQLEADQQAEARAAEAVREARRRAQIAARLLQRRRDEAARVETRRRQAELDEAARQRWTRGEER